MVLEYCVNEVLYTVKLYCVDVHEAPRPPPRLFSRSLSRYFGGGGRHIGGRGRQVEYRVL